MQKGMDSAEDRLKLTFRKNTKFVKSAPVYTTGMAIQNKIIQMQSVQYNVRSAKELLSAAEKQLTGAQELFFTAKLRIFDMEDNYNNVSRLQTISESIRSLSCHLGDFENTIKVSVTGLSDYKNMLESSDELLTSAISNSEATVSRMFDTD